MKPLIIKSITLTSSKNDYLVVFDNRLSNPIDICKKYQINERGITVNGDEFSVVVTAKKTLKILEDTVKPYRFSFQKLKLHYSREEDVNSIDSNNFLLKKAIYSYFSNQSIDTINDNFINSISIDFEKDIIEQFKTLATPFKQEEKEVTVKINKTNLSDDELIDLYKRGNFDTTYWDIILDPRFSKNYILTLVKRINYLSKIEGFNKDDVIDICYHSFSFTSSGKPQSIIKYCEEKYPSLLNDNNWIELNE